MATNGEGNSSPKSLTLAHYHGGRPADQYVSRSDVINEQQARVDKLPISKRWPFEAASTYMPMYAGVSGLIVNSFLRRMLMVHTRPLISAIPMAIIPGIAMKVGWYAFVTAPVLAGDLHCNICGEMRGGLVNVTLGAVYPLVIGIPFMSALAQGNHKVDVPKLSMAFTNWSKFSKFWTHKLHFFKLQFVTLAIFHVVAGSLVAKKQMDVVQEEVGVRFTRVNVPDEKQW